MPAAETAGMFFAGLVLLNVWFQRPLSGSSPTTRSARWRPFPSARVLAGPVAGLLGVREA